MRKSFLRIIAASSLILLMTLLLLTGASIRITGKVISERYAYDILSEAEGLTGRVMQDFTYRMISSTLSYELERITGKYSAKIIITYSNGYIWRVAEDGASSEPYLTYADDEIIKHFINPVVQYGEDIVKQRFRYGDKRYTAVAVPLRSRNSITGVVVLLAPEARMFNVIKDIRSRIFVIAAILFGIGLIICAWLAYRFLHPFKQITDAASPGPDGEYKPVSYEGGNADIKKLADSVNILMERMNDTENIRVDFVANVSHELRSPLTSMQGFIQALRDGVVAEDEREHYLDIVLSETKRLSKLVNDLLTLSQIENSKLSLDTRSFDICELARRSIIKHETRFHEKNITALMFCTEDKISVSGDEDRTVQVLDNLIDNAVKFSRDDGKITVMITESGESAYVSIIDEGIGIMKNDVPRLFERFYTANRAHTSGSGTGIGLAVVKNIIEQEGGSVYVSSTYGMGSIFTFILKRAAETAQPDG